MSWNLRAKKIGSLFGILFSILYSSFAHGESRWNGEWFPNVRLLNQDGKEFRFYDDLLKGKIVAINFVYTSCSNSCPLETAKLRQVQKELGSRVGKDIFLYSITLDPENDGPAELKAYRERYGVMPGWDFFTGKKEEINLIRRKLGLLANDEAEKKLEDHSLSLIVGNAETGRWLKRSHMDSPKLIARLLRDDLAGFRSTQANAPSYANAPKLSHINPAGMLFRGRCQVCHTIGGGDSVGPDLAGVVKKRERSWLVRWLQAPDRMLSERDPIAIELFEKYKKVVMPNLKLDNAEVDALLAYLAERSEILEQKSQRDAQYSK